MDQVRRNSMTPAHVAPLIAKGIQLKEKVVLAIEKDRSVWVVDPIRRGIKVNLWLPGRRRKCPCWSGRRLLCETSHRKNEYCCDETNESGLCRRAEWEIRVHASILLAPKRYHSVQAIRCQSTHSAMPPSLPERAAFRLVTEAVRLIEAAPSIDIERDILPFMEFKPLIEDVKSMPLSVFS